MTGLNLSPLFPVCVAENYPLPENNGNHGHDDPAVGDSPEMEPFRGLRGKFFVRGWPEPFNPLRAIHRPRKINANNVESADYIQNDPFCLTR